MSSVLSIAIDDRLSEVQTGSRLSYRIVLRNEGAPAKGLAVRQSLPDGLKLVEIGQGGRLASGQVRWVVDVSGDGAVELAVEGQVEAVPARKLMLASTACAAAGRDAAPIVCATDMNKLQAAGADQPSPVLPATPWALGALAFGAVLALSVVRRRLNRRGR